MTMRTRLPLSKNVTFRDAVDFSGFRDWRYTLSAIGAFMWVKLITFSWFCLADYTTRRAFYALFIPYFYIEQYALFEGVSPRLAQYLLAMINATGIPARILPGLFADKVGPCVNFSQACIRHCI